MDLTSILVYKKRHDRQNMCKTFEFCWHWFC